MSNDQDLAAVPVSQLTVSIMNDRAQRAVVYRTSDPSLNHLTLTVTNGTGAGVELNIGGSDPTVLALAFGRLLTEAEAAAAKITPPPGWTATYAAVGRFHGWKLVPGARRVVAAGESLTFLAVLPSVSGAVSASHVEVEYQNVGGLDDAFVDIQMFVFDPPGTAPSSRLPLSVGWMADTPSVVYVSPPGPSMIQSSLGLTLSNVALDGQGALAPLVDHPWGATPPALRISFVTIPRPSPDDPMPNPGLDALTYDEYAQGFAFEVVSDEMDDWEIQAPTASEALVWTLKPKNPGVLGPGASVEVWIKNICTTLPPFVTALYIQYVGFPGHADDYFVLHLQKSAPTPGVLGFYAEKSNIDGGDSALLCWSTLALEALELSYRVDGTSIVESYDSGDFALNERDYRITPKVDTTYTLTPFAGGQQLPARQVTVSVNQLAIKMQLNALTVGQDCDVYLSWQVQVSDGDYCVLDPGGIQLPLQGSRRALTVAATTTFSLTAVNSKQDPPSVVEQRTVTVVKPVIDSFSLSPASSSSAPLDAGTPITITWATRFASDRTLLVTMSDASPATPGTTPLPTESGTLELTAWASASYQLTLAGLDGPVVQTLVTTVKPFAPKA